MKTKKMAKTIIGVLAGLLLIGVVSSANALIINDPYSLTQSVPAKGEAIWSGHFDVTKFNSALGTLNSVTLAFSADIAAPTVTITTTGGNAGWSGVTLKDVITFDTTNTLTLGPTSSWSQSGVGNKQTVSNTFVGLTGSLNPITGALASYTGTDLLEIPVTVGAFTSTGTFNKSSITGTSGTATERLTVTYEYTPKAVVPVPAALWLLGSGLIGLAVLRRRTKV